MTHAATRGRELSAPELQLLLAQARYGGGAARHGRARAERTARRAVSLAGFVAATVWTFDLWLAVSHSL